LKGWRRLARRVPEETATRFFIFPIAALYEEEFIFPIAALYEEEFIFPIAALYEEEFYFSYRSVF